jgi:Tfp pilus assembly protein PilO
MVNQKAKLLTFITIVVLLLFIGSYYQFIKPLLTQREQTTDHLLSVEHEYKRMATTAVVVQEDPYIKLDQIRIEIPELPYEEQLIRTIRLAESKSGIQVSGIVPRVTRDSTMNIQGENADNDSLEGLANLIAVTVSYSGTHDQTERFLQAIEQSDRLLQITTLNMKVVDQLDSMVSSEIEITSYYVPDMKPLYDQPMLFTEG